MLRFRYISRGMFAAIILSVIIALMISTLPFLQDLKINQELPVFKQQKEYMLNDNNVVDFVAAFSTQMKIKKVIWGYETLSIDLIIEKDSQLDTNLVYQELYNIIFKGLVQTENVKKVLIRVFAEDMNKIFVAISANKADIYKNPTMIISTNMVYKDFLEQYFGLNYGNLIKQD